MVANRKNKNKNNKNSGLILKHIQPKNKRQEAAFREWSKGQNLVFEGWPGTGKSFLALYLALEEILTYKGARQLVIFRSNVSSRDLGFLKGDATEKMSVYEKPYKSLCSELFGREDAYEILKAKNIIKFEPTSFSRGMNLSNSILFLDEGQNMDSMELHTLLTRVGHDTRFILAGDLEQDDLTSKRYNTSTGFDEVTNILENISQVSSINFRIHDIVRSGFVKEYIIAKMKYNSQVSEYEES